MLEVDHVGMTYAVAGSSRRGVRAVDDVSLRLEAGSPEILAIIGESGSGKTTLARIDPQSSCADRRPIRFHGADVTRIRTNRERMAFMRQVQPIFRITSKPSIRLKRIDHYLYVSARRFANARGRIDIEGKADKALQQVGLSLAEVRGRFPPRAVGWAIAADRDRSRADLRALAHHRRRAGVDGGCVATDVDR